MGKGLLARLSGQRKTRLTEDRYVETHQVVKKYTLSSAMRVLCIYALLTICFLMLLTISSLHIPVITPLSPILIGLSGGLLAANFASFICWNNVIPDHVSSDLTPTQLLEFKAAVRKFRRRSDPVEVLEFKQAGSPRKHTVEFRYADMVFTSSVLLKSNQELELY